MALSTCFKQNLEHAIFSFYTIKMEWWELKLFRFHFCLCLTTFGTIYSDHGSILLWNEVMPDSNHKTKHRIVFQEIRHSRGIVYRALTQIQNTKADGKQTFKNVSFIFSLLNRMLSTYKMCWFPRILLI
jgi:hypothetical protein